MFDVKLRPDTEHDNVQMAVPNAHRADIVEHAARNFVEGDDFASSGGDGGNDC